MPNIKVFECGLCPKNERIGMTRYGLRKHLREEHLKKGELTNTDSLKKGVQKIKRKWWIEREQ